MTEKMKVDPTKLLDPKVVEAFSKKIDKTITEKVGLKTVFADRYLIGSIGIKTSIGETPLKVIVFCSKKKKLAIAMDYDMVVADLAKIVAAAHNNPEKEAETYCKKIGVV